ncbi:MAG: NADPH:quinone reductase, partial [Sphingomonas bacterium]|nr:NADPH:quinone reductase [Sphingomonas bacterium]
AEGASLYMNYATSWFALHRAGVQPGETVLVHGAAGGVGTAALDLAPAFGARTIAVVSSDEKADAARRCGADEVVRSDGPWLQDVRALTDGKGVSVVFDGVGAASWAASMAATARCGLVVTYGNASGPVPPFSPLELNRAGSLFVTRPKLYDYIAEPGALQAAAARLFGLIADGTLTVDIGQRFALAEVAAAHRALEARQTTGSTILIP